MSKKERSLARLLEQIEEWRALDGVRRDIPYPQQENQYLIHVPSRKFPELRAAARSYNKAFKRADKNACRARQMQDDADEVLWWDRETFVRMYLFDIIGVAYDDKRANALYDYILKCETDYIALAKTFVALTHGTYKDE